MSMTASNTNGSTTMKAIKICEQLYGNTLTTGNIRVMALKSEDGKKFAVRVNWPAGMDNFPSQKFFEDEFDAMAGYVVACGHAEKLVGKYVSCR